jgi:hypothetical protein
MKSYPSSSKLRYPLHNCFPKLEKKIKFGRENAVKKFVSDLGSARMYELKGGICFKVICIIFQIMEVLQEEDLSDFLEFYMDGK